MDKTFTDLIDYCQSNNRICPQPMVWSDLCKLLPPNKMGVRPRAPLILAAWWDTSVLLKQIRFLEHIHWAFDNGALEEIDRFVRSLPEDQWHHFSE